MRTISSTPRSILTLASLLASANLACDAPPLPTAEHEAPIINGSQQVEANSSMIKIATADALCSGALLRNDWVVTAKHCLEGGAAEDPVSISALMGIDERTGRRVVLHKDYDVALVQVGPRFIMNGSVTGFYRDLHRHPTSDLDDQWLLCYGYGRNTFEGGDGVLRSGDVHVYTTDQDSFRTEPFPGNGTIGWQGDSGGPCFLVNNEGSVIAGIMSTATSFLGTVLNNGLVAANRFRDWSDWSIGQDDFGGAMATGDFDGDNFDDLAIGFANHSLSGRVAIFRGTSTGFVHFATLDQSLHGETNFTGDRFGAALTAGDFDGDGDDDLAVGVPGKMVGAERSGVILLFRGGTGGMTAFGQLNQNGFGVNERSDEFAASLASGDFDNDGLDDLAIGAPGEAPGSDPRFGVVFALRSTGTTFTHDATLEPSSGEYYDRFGHALAVGDFNNDGRDDLAVGAPGAASSNSGSVTIFRGSSTGLASAAQTLTQLRSLFPLSVDHESGDLFGWSLTAGDFDGDSDDDLAVGVPGEVIGGAASAGNIWLFRSSGSLVYWAELSQTGLGGDEHGDFFAAALAAGDLDNDGKDDLLAGAPSEAPGSAAEGGFGFGFHGTTAGPVAWAAITQIDGDGEHDRFGATIVTGDFNNDGRDDVAIARPGDATVDIFRGSASGPTDLTSLSMP